MFARILRHLLPRALAWRVTKTTKTIRLFIDGIAESQQDVKDYADDVFDDAFPDTTRELAEWEGQFGLTGEGNDATRRQDLDTAWKATGGQSISYLQGLLQNAGFDVYLHEWWASVGPPRVPRDPRLYTTLPKMGEYRCFATGEALQSNCMERRDEDGALLPQPRCSAYLVNDPGYLVNDTLSNRAPPPVPDDQDRWRGFIYVAGETFPDIAVIPAGRRKELERLILKHFPMQHWVVLMVSETEPPELGLFNFDVDEGWNLGVWETY